jgi:hypothetical protein
MFYHLTFVDLFTMMMLNYTHRTALWRATRANFVTGIAVLRKVLRGTSSHIIYDTERNGSMSRDPQS